VTIRLAAGADLQSLAAIHAQAFDDAWSADDIRRFSSGPGAWALVAESGEGLIDGFILCRSIAGEAEILTLAVRPERRRQGLASALVAAALALARSQAQSMLLEVAADNPAAVALYERAGFSSIGRRAAYYGRRSGGAVDALVMRRALNS
jgi:ribosomal-protein-alanine N-acetyltransferase